MAPKSRAQASSNAQSSGGGITFGHSSTTPYTPKNNKISSSTTSSSSTQSSSTVQSTIKSTTQSLQSTTTSAVKSSVNSLKSSSKQLDPHNAHDVLNSVWSKYTALTPQRTKLLDAFMGFLVAVGVLQFVYCVIVGNFPFNAFLSGFSATVGQFVLTASLRMQTNPENASEFGSISHERAFADYVFGSLLLHFFCVNFIN